MRLSVQMPALVDGLAIDASGCDTQPRAARHLRVVRGRASTRMNPNAALRAGDPRTRAPGAAPASSTRSISVEVARAHRAAATARPGGRSRTTSAVAPLVRRTISTWLTTARAGKAERDTTNNHATCWVMQVAAFAHLHRQRAAAARRAGRGSRRSSLRADGAGRQLPARARPHQAVRLLALQSRGDGDDLPDRSRRRRTNLWTFELPDGRGMRRAMAFMVPYHQRQEADGRSRRTSYATRTGRCGRASLLFRRRRAEAVRRISDLWSPPARPTPTSRK